MLVRANTRTLRRGGFVRAAQNFADDIGILADEEQCDVIVDDIAYLLE